MDIGGGSTELIIGEGLAAQAARKPLHGLHQPDGRALSDGTISEKRMKRATHRRPARGSSRSRRASCKYGWDAAFGASGTPRAVSGSSSRAERQNRRIATGPASSGSSTKVPARRRHLAAQAAGSCRRTVRRFCPAGSRSCVEAFDMLGIESMRVADGALREGLSTTCSAVSPTRMRAPAACARWKRGITSIPAQADRVEATAVAFLHQVREDWGLQEPLSELVLRSGGSPARDRPQTSRNSHYHRHGASPAAARRACRASPREEQQLLAALVGRPPAQARPVATPEELVPPWHLKAEFPIMLLRLAVLLHRGARPALRARDPASGEGWVARARLPNGLARPSSLLTEADLEQEIPIWRRRGSGCALG